MLMRIAENKDPSRQVYEPTIGVDCRNRTFLHGEDNLRVRLQLWDTAGQERFRTLTTSYYRGTHCCVLVFDITNPESFYHLYQWIDQYNYYCEFPVKNIVIVGNKYDLEDQRRVSEMEIKQFCDSMECAYVPCSVKDNTGLDALVTTIIEKSIELENSVVGSTQPSKSGSQALFTMGGSDGLTSGDIKNINPLKLNVKKKERKCCQS